MARTSAAARPLTDHEKIRSWAQERGAKPACVRRTGGQGDVGMIRLDFPGYSGEGSLEPISWDEWFQKFDDTNLALLVQDQTADGEQSNFNKLVSRETVEVRGERLSARNSKRPSGRRTTGSNYSRSEAGEDLDEHEYIEMSEADREEDMEDADLELEEEDELEGVDTGGRDTAGRSKRKRQTKTNGRGRTRSGTKAKQTARGRNRHTARGTSSQSRSARGRKGSGARKATAKKAPGRTEMKSSRRSRRRAA